MVSERVIDDAVLTQKIKTIHSQSDGVYGSPRIHAALQKQGIKVARKRVERLMREAGLKGRLVLVTSKQPKIK
ncbi:MAG: IS3 family transposase [Pseudomonadota bacterium]|nr:IS3 family transposase [Pseudomonadota bacterium]